MVISFNKTPPAVTNSSLNIDLPVTSKGNSAMFLANKLTFFFGASDQVVSLLNPLAITRADHNLRGIIIDDCNGHEEETSFLGEVVVIDHNFCSISLTFDPNSGAQ